MSRTRRERTIIIVIGLLAITWTSFTYIGRESLWYDEAYTWWMASQVSVKESIASSVYEIIPPGSYLLWRGWIALTGETEFAMRMLAALMCIITTAAFTRVMGRLTERNSYSYLAFIAAAFYSPVLLWASSEVRMYGPLLCFCALSAMALMEVLFTRRRRQVWLSLWALFSLASLYMTITAVFWLLAEGLFTAMIVVHRLLDKHYGTTIWREVRGFIVPTAAIAAGFLPWVIAALPSLGINTGYWPGRLTMGAFLSTALQGMTTLGLDPFDTQPWILGGIACGLAVLMVLLSKAPLRAKLFPLAGLIALLLQGVMYRDIPKWCVRHATLYAPFVLLALSLAAAKREARNTQTLRRSLMGMFLSLLWFGGLVSIGFGRAVMLDADYPQHEDWRAAAAYVEAQRQPGDMVIIETGSVYPTWVYYAGDEGLLPLPDEKLLNVYNVLNYDNTAPVLDGVLEQGQQVFVVDWLGDVTDPTDIVGALLEDQGIEQETPDFHGLDVRSYAMTNVHGFPEEPPNVTRVDEELLPGLTLRGMTMPGAIPNDGVLDILTWWQTDDPAAHEGKFYQVSVRLKDARGYTWLQFDAPPGGEYRPERWKAGEVVLGRFQAALPESLKPDQYHIDMVLYDEQGVTVAYPLGSVRLVKGDTRFQLNNDGYDPVASGEDVGIALSGIHVNQESIKPGETLTGELRWYVRNNLQPEYGYEIRLGEYTASYGLIDDLDTTLWEPNDEFRTSFFLPIPPRALDTQASLEVRLHWDMSEGYTWTTVPVTITAHRAFNLVDNATPIAVQAGEMATLVGYQLPERIKASDPFTVTLHWRADVETDVPVKVFVHVTALDNVIPIVQHDAQPADNARPFYSWVQDEIVTDAHPLDGLPAGSYAVRVGLYGPDGVRLPLHSDAVEVIDDTLLLPQTLVVQ